jgi:hypothetical protein
MRLPTLAELSRDRALACEVFFSHRHEHATPDFHVEMMDLWACADECVLIEAFREAAKSTRAEEFLLLEGCFANFSYALIIGETYTKACQRLDAIQHEALANEKLRAAFGPLRGETWTENKAELRNGVLIEAFGWEQEIRGFNHRGHRPDRAFLDDVENKARVRSPEAVDASVRKLYLEILPALDKARRKVRVTGTELAPDCMLSRLANDPSWVARRFRLCDRDPCDPLANPTWPARYPLAWCRGEKHRYEQAGMLSEFNQEYMLEPSGATSRTFEESQIRFEATAPLAWMPRHLIVDPARTARESSSRVGRVAISRSGSTIYVHASRGDYLAPDKIIDALFEEHAAHPLAGCHVEKDSLDEWLLQPIRARMLASGVALPLRPLSAPRDRDKIAFIKALQPFFAAGDIVFVGTRANHAQLIAEILNYPQGKLDVLNALAYATRIFAREPVYPDFAAQHVAADLEPATAQTPLALAFQEDQSGCAAVLAAVEAGSLHVLADWSSPGAAADIVASVTALARTAYPNHRLSVFVPGDAFDLRERSTLVYALQAARLTPYRAPYARSNRGALAQLMRTLVKGRPRLRVDSRAQATASALAYGYGHPLLADGRPAPEPERTLARTLGEALECLTFAFIGTHNVPNELPEGASTALTPSGHRYITARPVRSA